MKRALRTLLLPAVVGRRSHFNFSQKQVGDREILTATSFSYEDSPSLPLISVSYGDLYCYFFSYEDSIHIS